MNATCRSTLSALALGLILAPCGVAGEIVFDTLGGLYSNLADTYASIGSTGPLYQSFTAESQFVVNTLDLRLARPDGATGGSIAAYLFNNDESFNLPDLGRPVGSLPMGYLGSLADSSITQGAAVYSISFAGQFLDPGARYWIVVTAAGGSNVQWAAVQDVTGIQTPPEFSLTQADFAAHVPVVSGNGNSPYRARVSYQEPGYSYGVPEPSAFALGGCGLCLFAIIRRRGRIPPGRDKNN
jgi:hypothetical protein